jgi:Dolichyl-phosphate-mannose-protein mannosyltransferase
VSGVSNRNGLYDRLSVALFLMLTLIVAGTFRHYGASWDEPLQYNYGAMVVHYYTSSFKDLSALYVADFNLQYYGGFFEVVSWFATRILPFGIYETRHLISALCGIVGIVACWRLVRFLSGTRAAFWTALLLALYPPYYGHMFINSKDIPFAVFYVLSLYMMLHWMAEFPQVSAKTTAKLGLAIGLTMATRVGGIVLLCYLYLFSALLFIHLLVREKGRTLSLSASVTRIFSRLAMVSLMAWGVMLLFWPYAQANPFVRPFTTLTEFSAYGPYQPSADYLARHLAFKLPELVIALLAAGLCIGIWTMWTKRRQLVFSRTLSHFLLIAAAVLPVTYAVAKHMHLYDEMRHFLFVIPPLICLAGITLNRMLEWLAQRRLIEGAAVASLAVYLLFQVRLMVQLHPYEYSYYNRMIGGVHGANQKGYLTEYWGTSYREGVLTLVDYLRDRDGSEFERKQYKIFLGPAPWCATYYFPTNFVKVDDVSQAQIYLSITRYGLSHTGREVLRVGRFDTPFLMAIVPD